MTNSYLTPLLQRLPALVGQAGKSGVMLGTVCSIDLNLKGFPFVGWSTAESRCAVQKLLLPVIDKLAPCKWVLRAPLEELTQELRYLLLERGQITPTLAARRDNASVLINDQQDTLCLINDEEHLSFQRFTPGAAFDASAADSLLQLRDALAHELPLAYSGVFGYTMGDPTKSGEALYFSVLMRLPALRLDRRLEAVFRALEDMEVFYSPLFPGFKEDVGDLYLLHAPSAPLHKREQLLERMQYITHDLARQELNARARLLQGAKSAAKLQKATAAALRSLSHAKQLKYKDMLESLSLIRLGLDTGLLKAARPKKAEQLLCRAYLEAAPAFLRFCRDCRTRTASRKARAAYMQELFTQSLSLTPTF